VLYLPTFDYQILDDHLYLIVPLLLRTSSRKFIHSEVGALNKVSVKTLNEMVNCSTFREHTAQVVH
jgi:serine/threonine-protein kinase mTOR